MFGAGGGAQASIDACNLAFLICMPIFALGGAVIGGVVGGAVAGGITGLPQQQAEAFSERASTIFQSFDVAAAMRDDLQEKASRRWHIDDTGVRTRVIVQIESMYFAQANHDQLALRMTASLAAVLGEDETGKASKRYIFSFNGINYGVDQWLAEDGMLMQREAQSALQNLSDQMIEALRNPP